MFSKCKKYNLLVFALILLIGTIYLFCLDWQDSHRKFTFAMLNVGQGDGFFIESPTGTEVLVDAGPPGKIMGELPQVMSPFDKSIDAIMISHPDADHISGFLDVLKNYKVKDFFDPGISDDSKTYQNLRSEVKRQNIPTILARRGMRLDLGGGVVIDILFPDRDVSTWNTNDGSIVARLSYNNISVMLTGDATTKTEKIILQENSPQKLQSTILKVSHHGSRSATSPDFVQAVSPVDAFISVGENNKYGHPHQETLDTLALFGVKIFRTDELGTVILKSDGKNYSITHIKQI
jgi:competence protein ComEC